MPLIYKYQPFNAAHGTCHNYTEHVVCVKYKVYTTLRLLVYIHTIHCAFKGLTHLHTDHNQEATTYTRPLQYEGLTL